MQDTIIRLEMEKKNAALIDYKFNAFNVEGNHRYLLVIVSDRGTLSWGKM